MGTIVDLVVCSLLMFIVGSVGTIFIMEKLHIASDQDDKKVWFRRPSKQQCLLAILCGTILALLALVYLLTT